ncbi:hypothetical protein GJAV_G00041870 [Gymnothorax javanicus]|nr:hypothetical protein GJAV_G00041870 [Gymnothorax javanicus]
MAAQLYLCLSALLGHLGGVLACRVGTQKECEAASFVPGHNLAGEGFDIVRLQRKTAFVIDLQTFLTANNTCTLCKNKVNGDELQKLPVSVVDWRSYSSCQQELSSVELKTINSVAQTATNLIQNDWTVGLDIKNMGGLIVGGSHARAVKFATSVFKIDKFSFTAHQFSCSHYRYRVLDSPPLSLEFRRQLDSLPQEYNLNNRYLYKRFINTYGTHYIQQVSLGGRLTRLNAIRTCLASVNSHSATEVKDCLATSFSVGLGFFDPSVATHQCRSLLNNYDSKMGSHLHYLKHITEVIGGNNWLGEVSLTKVDSAGFQSWLTSLKDAPQVVSYSLFPLHELIPNPVIRENVKTAIKEYLRESAIPEDGPAERCLWQPNLSDNCCPLKPKWGRLKVTVSRAWGLRGDGIWSKTDAYVRVKYWHYSYRTYRIDEDNSPHWNEHFDLGHVEAFHKLTLEIWDVDDWGHRHSLGICYTMLKEGNYDCRCTFDDGERFYFSYSLTCDRQLKGYQCAEYKSAPS